MADKRENIDVTVELHDELSRPARRAEDSIDDLGDEVKELAAESAAATTQTGRLERALRALRRASGSAAKDADDNTTATKRWTVAQQALAKSNDQLVTALRRSGKESKGFGFIMKALKLPAIASALTLVAAGVSGIGAAAVAATAGLAPLVGTLAAVPALLLGIGAAVAGTKLAFSGVGEALKVVLDATKSSAEQAAALRQLTPEGRELVGVLKSLKEETDGWKDAIQAAALPGFTLALRQLNPLLPVTRDGLVNAGRAMGVLAAEVANVASGRRGDLRTIFAQSTRMIDTGLSPALQAATRLLFDFGVAGGPLAERFARWIGVSATKVADLVEEGRRTGALQDFLQRAGDLAADVGAVVGDLAVGLFNVGKAAGGLASSMGGSFATMISDWRAWTESISGQNTLAEWFRDAGPLIHEVGRMMKALGQTFVDLAADGAITQLLRQVNDQLIPAMSDFAQTASQLLGPALVSLATSFFEFQAALGQTPLPEMLMGIATVIGAVVDGFAALPGPVRFALAAFLAFNFASKITGALVSKLGGQVSPVGKAFGDLRAGVQLYTEGLTGLPRAAGAARGAMAGLASAGKGLLGVMGGPWGLALAAGTTALGFWMNKQAEAKAHVDSLKSSLDQQTGAITEGTRALVAQALEEDGVLKKADELGVSMSLVTDAAMGNKDAVDALASAYANADGLYQFDAEGYKTLTAEGQAWDALRDAVKEQSAAVDGAVASGRRVTEALRSSAGAAGSSARQMGIAEYAAAGLMSTTKAFGGEVQQATGKLRGQGNAVGYVIVKVRELNGEYVSNMRTLIGYKETVSQAMKTLRDGAKSIDINTQAGRDNVSALLDMAESAASIRNENQRQAAMKDATQKIRQFGIDAGLSGDKLKRFVGNIIEVKEEVRSLNGMEANITVSANGLQQIIIDADRARGAIQDMVASQGQVRVTPRRDGGPIAAGAPYRVGEVGPELLVTASGVDVIGRHGQEQRRFAESGYVLPNEVYRAYAAEEAAPTPLPVAAPAQRTDRPRPSRDHDLEQTPELHFHVPGNQTNLTEADFRRIALDAYRQHEREKKERR